MLAYDSTVVKYCTITILTALGVLNFSFTCYFRGNLSAHVGRDERSKSQIEISYTDYRELLMDILKFGADVDVFEPKTLRVQMYGHVSRDKYFFTVASAATMAVP